MTSGPQPVPRAAANTTRATTSARMTTSTVLGAKHIPTLSETSRDCPIPLPEKIKAQDVVENVRVHRHAEAPPLIDGREVGPRKDAKREAHEVRLVPERPDVVDE